MREQCRSRMQTHRVVLDLGDVVRRRPEQPVGQVAQGASDRELLADLRDRPIVRIAPGTPVTFERRPVRRGQHGVGRGEGAVALDVVRVEEVDGDVPGVGHGSAPVDWFLSAVGRRAWFQGSARAGAHTRDQRPKDSGPTAQGVPEPAA
jgi:hypothetical protein